MVSDEASVLSGKRAGVQALLTKEVNCHLTYIWCISHRLQLATKDSLKKGCPNFNNLNEFLKSLYLFHSGSNVVSSAFRNAVDIRNRKGSTAVIRVDGTRWINHMLNALTNVLNTIDCHHDCLVALQEAENFSQIQKAKAKYFDKKLTDNIFVEFMIFALDVITVLARFSLFSQAADMSYCAVNGALDRLELMRDKPDSPTEWQKYMKGDYKDKLSGVQIRNDDKYLSQTDKVKTLVILLECVRGRCGHSVSAELEALFPLLDTRSWKPDKLYQLVDISANGIRNWRPTTWLDKEISDIKECPCITEQLTVQGVDVQDILLEWRAMKRKLPRMGLEWKNQPEDSGIQWCEILNKVSAEDFANLTQLVDFLGTFGLSSAEAERGCSQAKVVKTDKRATLGQIPFQDQLLVKLEGPTIEAFDPVPAIEAWSSNRHWNRTVRPSFMNNKEGTQFVRKPKNLVHVD